MLVRQGLPEHSRPNQTGPRGTDLNVPFCTHSSERTLNVQGFWPTWRATNQHAPNTDRGQAKKASSASSPLRARGSAQFVSSGGFQNDFQGQ